MKNSFSFLRYRPLKSFVLLIQKVSEKGRENLSSTPRVTRKGTLTSTRSLGSLHLRFYQEGEEGIKWELGFALFLSRKMGLASLGLECLKVGMGKEIRDGPLFLSGGYLSCKKNVRKL